MILILQQLTFAQQNNTSNEKANPLVDEAVFINMNSTTFVNGETLYYKLNCFKNSDKKPSTISKVAYVELIDGDKKVIFRNKLFLENGSGDGDYFIPSTLKTGNYKLIGYTNWMLNLSVAALFQCDIFIINPFQEVGLNQKTQNADTVANENKYITDFDHLNNSNIPNDIIKLNLDKKTFNNRELVNLKIESLKPILKDGHYAISVRKVDSLPSKKQVSSVNFYNENKNQPNKFTTILPELRGEMISGKITSKTEGKAIQNIIVALSIPGSSYISKVVKTNADGSFNFNIDKISQSANMFVQVLNDNHKNYTVVLDAPIQPKYQDFSIDPALNLNPEIENSLEQRAIATQIENAYYNVKKDSILAPQKINPFYTAAAKDYILDDFTRFTSLKETIVEIVKEMYFIQKDKNMFMYVRDMNIMTQSTQPPLIIIDGLFIQDQNELFDYKMENVYKISIIEGPYFLGPKNFNGLVSFTTKSKDYVTSQSGNYIVNTPVLKPNLQKDYYNPNYVNPSLSERIPDYRYQLLWNPKLKLADTTTAVSFYTSDINGTFEIKIEGFTNEGIPVSLSKSFEVR